MKLHELENQQSVTLDSVDYTGQGRPIANLIDHETGRYYVGEVNVTGSVDLNGENLTKLPVKFGKVGGFFACENNQLTSLEGVPREIGRGFYCSNNLELTSLEGIHKIIKIINGKVWLTGCPITSGGIGLLLIEGLTGIVANHPAFDIIINRYIGQGKKGLLRCQDELIEAGYEEFARL